MISSSRYSAIRSIAVVLCLSATASAEKQSPLAKLRAEYDEAMKAWEKKYSGLRGTPNTELIERYDTWPGWWFLPRIVKLGTTDPTAPYSFDVLKWAAVDLSNSVGARDRQYYPYDEQVFAALRRDHLSNPRIVDLFENSSRYPTAARETFLRECSEKGSTREVRGLASYYLVELLRHKGEDAARFRTPRLDSLDPFQKYVWHRQSSGYLSFLSSVDAEKTLADSEAIRQRIMDELADVEWPDEHPFAGGKTTLGFMTRLQRAQASAVKVGEPAPELAGKDLAGVERKLADYEGKVVVLHFWATYFPPSAEKLPQLLKLSQQYDGKQFCILGINLDLDRQAAEKSIKAKTVTWPSWAASDLGESTGRLIPFRSWPDVIVIDHKGELRYYNPKGDELEKAVETLLQELAQGESTAR